MAAFVSSDEKHINMVINTSITITTEETSDAFTPCADNDKCDKIKCCNMSKMSNVVENVCHIENSTGHIGSNDVKFSSQETTLKKSNDHIKSLIDNGMSDRAAFCSHVREKIEIHNTPIAKRRHPRESHTLAMAHNLHSSSSTRHEKIRNTVPQMMLPDARIMFSMSEKNKTPLDLFFNSSKNSDHAHMLRKIAFCLRNKHKNALTNN